MDWYAMSVMIIGAVVTSATLTCIYILHSRKKANIQYMSEAQIDKVKDWRWKIRPILLWGLCITAGSIFATFR